MQGNNTAPSGEQITSLLYGGYVPFRDIKRAIPWPTDPENSLENDAEHSFSLAFVACAVAHRLGLDVGMVSQYAIVHDFPEVFAGDVSVWDDEGLKHKARREAAALEKISDKWSCFPWLAGIIQDYESQASEEARLVYALDKYLAVLMIVHGDGYFWKSNGITHDMHLKKVGQVRPRIASHPLVLGWYDELLAEIEANQAALFAPNHNPVAE